MYKYSRYAQDKFFEYATCAFLFAWFQANPKAQSFSAERFAENKNAHYPERMTDEITHLAEEALKKLQYPYAAQRISPLKSFMGQEADIEQMRRTLVTFLQNNKVKWEQRILPMNEKGPSASK